MFCQHFLRPCSVLTWRGFRALRAWSWVGCWPGVLGLQEGSGLIWRCREGSGISLGSSVCKFDEWGKWKYFEFWFIFFG